MPFSPSMKQMADCAAMTPSRPLEGGAAGGGGATDMNVNLSRLVQKGALVGLATGLGALSLWPLLYERKIRPADTLPRRQREPVAPHENRQVRQIGRASCR